LGKKKKEGNFERFFEDELERERPRIRAGNGEAKNGERRFTKREGHVGHDFFEKIR